MINSRCLGITRFPLGILTPMNQLNICLQISIISERHTSSQTLAFTKKSTYISRKRKQWTEPMLLCTLSVNGSTIFGRFAWRLIQSQTTPKDGRAKFLWVYVITVYKAHSYLDIAMPVMYVHTHALNQTRLPLFRGRCKTNKNTYLSGVLRLHFI